MVRREDLRVNAKKKGVKEFIDQRGNTIGARKPKIFLKPFQREYYFQQLELNGSYALENLKTLEDKIQYAKFAAKALLFSKGWEIWKYNGSYKIFADAIRKMGMKERLMEHLRSENAIRSHLKQQLAVNVTAGAASEFPPLSAPKGQGVQEETTETPSTSREEEAQEDKTPTPTRGRMRKRLLFNQEDGGPSSPKRRRSRSRSASLGTQIRAIFRREFTPKRLQKRYSPLKYITAETLPRVNMETTSQSNNINPHTPKQRPLSTPSTASVTPETPAAGHKSPGIHGRWIRHRRSPKVCTCHGTPVRSGSSVRGQVGSSREEYSSPQADSSDEEEGRNNTPQWSPLSDYGRSLASPDYRPITPESDPETETARQQMKQTADAAIQTASREEATTVLADLVIARRHIFCAAGGVNSLPNLDLKERLVEMLSEIQDILRETNRRATPEGARLN
jgi:hypothetical protein